MFVKKLKNLLRGARDYVNQFLLLFICKPGVVMHRHVRSPAAIPDKVRMRARCVDIIALRNFLRNPNSAAARRPPAMIVARLVVAVFLQPLRQRLGAGRWGA